MDGKVASVSQIPTSDPGVVAALTDRLPVGSGGHVLVAGSDAHARDRHEAQLLDAGFRVSVARTGFEAIVKATCHVPDAILLDESLLDLDAAETGRLLTTCPVTAHIPVIRLAPSR